MASVSALGSSPEQLWAGYTTGRALFKPTSSLPYSPLGSYLPDSLVKQLDELAKSDSNYARLDRSVLMAILAARQTLKQAGISTQNLGVNLGSSRGATQLFEAYYDSFLNQQQAKTLASPTTTLGNISAWVAQDLGAQGAAISHSVTCSTGLHAVLNGIAWLTAGMADSFLVGATEAPLTPFTVGQMQALKIYSRDSGVHPCRALDFKKKSNTMILGEAAATAILRKGKHKDAQGHIIGYGWGTEVLTHHTSLTMQASCFVDAMQRALDGANLETVDAIVAHAPGTILGDQAEFNAIKRIFGNEIPFLTTNKTIIGHTLGASGMMSLEMALLMLSNNTVIDPIYYSNLNKSAKPLKTVLVNAVGFGGNAVSIIVTK